MIMTTIPDKKDLKRFDKYDSLTQLMILKDVCNRIYIARNIAMSQDSIVDNLELIIKSQFHGLWQGSGMWLTHAYAINQKACKILLEETQVQTGGLDWQLTGIQSKFQSFGFMPSRITQQPLKKAPSQIHHTQ